MIYKKKIPTGVCPGRVLSSSTWAWAPLLLGLLAEGLHDGRQQEVRQGSNDDDPNAEVLPFRGLDRHHERDAEEHDEESPEEEPANPGRGSPDLDREVEDQTRHEPEPERRPCEDVQVLKPSIAAR